MTAKRPPEEDAVNMWKMIAWNPVSAILDEECVSGNGLYRTEKEANSPVNNTENQVDTTNATQVVGKNIFEAMTQLSLSE